MNPRPRLMNLALASSSLLYVFFAVCVKGQDQQSNGNKSLPPPPPSLVSPPPTLLSPPPPSPFPPPRAFTPPPLLHPLLPLPWKPPPPPPWHHPTPRSHHENHPNLVSSENRADSRKQDVSINLGKEFGLLFIGIAVILQVGVMGFLAFKRRQLLEMCD